jgi:hypothetical protein
MTYQNPASLQTSIHGPSTITNPATRVNQSTNTNAGQAGRNYSPLPASYHVVAAARLKASAERNKTATNRISTSIPKSIIVDLNERAKRNAAQTPQKVAFAVKNPFLQPKTHRKVSPHNPSEANTKFGQSDNESEDSLEHALKSIPKPLKKDTDSFNSSTTKMQPKAVPETVRRLPAKAEDRDSAQRVKHAELPLAQKSQTHSTAQTQPPLKNPYDQKQEQVIQQVSTDDRIGISESLKSSLADEDFIHLETLSKNGLFSGKDDQEDQEEIEPLEEVEPSSDLRSRLKDIFEKNQRLNLQAQVLQPPREAKSSTTLATMMYKPKNR